MPQAKKTRRRRNAVHPHACGECLVDVHGLTPVDGSPPRLWGMHFTGGVPPTPFPVHPHACGECLLRRCHLRKQLGSPPCLWGMRPGWRQRTRQQRFTPTPVGNASCSKAAIWLQTVHPHACGECVDAYLDTPPEDGSPPRLWGMRNFIRRHAGRRRFTPTPVGNAHVTSRTEQIRTVHPHACGECTPLRVSPYHVSGSPPRLWGMRCSLSHPAPPRRFTPTPVGNAVRESRIAHCMAVHPHACGECVFPPRTLAPVAGSPPRLWGMLRYWRRHACKGRFTPTPVGNAPTARKWTPSIRFTPTPVGNARGGRTEPMGFPVHPHACGECALALVAFSSSRGSPPRLWGMQDWAEFREAAERFTPTPVGNAVGASGGLSSAAVHPHACGECASRRSASFFTIGSPPRLWGMLPPAHCDR